MNAPGMKWRDAISTPPDAEEAGRFLAVRDTPFACNWHFATLLPDGRWIDLNSGGEIHPTHWMPLPVCPSEQVPA